MVYSLYASGNATTSASLDIREDDTIEGVLLEVDVAAPPDAASLEAELSFLSTNQATTNDTSGVLCSTKIAWELVTSGAGMTTKQIYVPMNEPVQAGERMYLHHLPGGAIGAASRSRAFIYTGRKQGAATMRRAERRR